MASKKRMPENYQSMVEHYPEYMAALDAVGKAAAQAGPLPEKTRQLVQLAAAAAIRSEGAVHSHARRALSAGASPEEVRHAVISTTSTIGFPNVMAALSWVNDILNKT
ncbi:MAG: carboxymuconolactone decarboxylase family protein [Gammaproteobacteria bacterium]|nr:carboxymuconolactone decarboxylase family protein [Gammaproteobacteria bacterium]